MIVFVKNTFLEVTAARSEDIVSTDRQPRYRAVSAPLGPRCRRGLLTAGALSLGVSRWVAQAELSRMSIQRSRTPPARQLEFGPYTGAQSSNSDRLPFFWLRICGGSLRPTSPPLWG